MNAVYKAVEHLREQLQGAGTDPVIRTSYGAGMCLELPVARSRRPVGIAGDRQFYELRLLVPPFRSAGGVPAALATRLTEQLSDLLAAHYFVVHCAVGRSVREQLWERTRLVLDLGVDFILRGRVERSSSGTVVTVSVVHGATQQIVGSVAVPVDEACASVLPERDSLGLLAQRVANELMRVTFRSPPAPTDPGPGRQLLAMLPALLSFRRGVLEVAQLQLSAMSRSHDVLGFWLQLHFTLAHFYDYWSAASHTQERSLALAERGAELGGDSGSMTSLLSVIHAWRGDHVAAVATAQRVRTDGIDAYLVFLQKGYAYSCAGRVSEAIESIASSQALVPHHPLSFQVDLTLARVHAVTGDWEQALHCAQRCHARSPRFPEGVLWLAVAYALAGRVEEARRVIGRPSGAAALAAAWRARPARGQAWEKPLLDGLARLGLPGGP